MRFPIDLLFCSEEHEVLRTTENLRPWRISSYCRAAEYVIELPVGTIAAAELRPGDYLSFADPE